MPTKHPPPTAAVPAVLLKQAIRALLPFGVAAMFVPSAALAAQAPHSMTGAFEDDYGNSFIISDSLWVHEPAYQYEIVSWHPDESYLVARNGANNPVDVGLWTRIDWVRLEGMAPYQWAFCLTEYRAATAADARATPAADASSPRDGCNGHPYSRMKPSLDVEPDQATRYHPNHQAPDGRPPL